MNILSLENVKQYFSALAQIRPMASAKMSGAGEGSGVSGTVYFYNAPSGTVVVADINGLPHEEGACNSRVFGFHIHEGGRCAGNSSDPFADTGGHFNPLNCPHPAHAGDMPPLFENNGYSFMAFYTERFKVNEVIGRTIVIHGMPDDFKSQPSGDSGMKIACGVIAP